MVGIRSLYNTACQERHPRINDQLSRVVARYAADDGFRDAVASSMGVTRSAMDRLMEDLMRCEDVAQVRFPARNPADPADPRNRRMSITLAFMEDNPASVASARRRAAGSDG